MLNHAAKLDQFRVNSAGGNLGSVRTGVGCTRSSLLSRERIGLIVVGIMVLFWLSSDDSSQDPIPMRLAQGEAGVMTLGIAFSPDGKSIATIDTAGRVAIWDNEDDWRINRFLDCGGHAWSVAFSPDGRLLAVGGRIPTSSCSTCLRRSPSCAQRAGRPDHGFGVLARREYSRGDERTKC